MEWSRCEGGDVEHVVAMLLCQEYPNAERIRPSIGDGGQDVRVPIETGYQVYQVKKFAENLTSSQKSQIVESLSRLRIRIQETAMPVPEWHLVMPLDPTTENSEWLTELTKADDFLHYWKGLTFVDALAAKHSAIIDYYLRDGKERLQSAMEALASAMAVLGSTSPLTAASADTGLAGIFTSINALDPHYRYEFDVSAQWRTPPIDDDLVFAFGRSHGTAFVTFRVYAKFREALRERPISMALELPIQENPDLAQQIADFTKYGAGFTSPPVAELTADLPGGLGGRFSKSIVRFSDNTAGEPAIRRFQAVSPQGTVAAEARVSLDSPSVGLTGKGVRVTGREMHGVFTCEIRTDLENQSMGIQFAPQDITGLAVADVLNGVRFLDELGSPNRLRVCLPAGPATEKPIPETFARTANPAARRLIEDLATIQDHTPVQMVVPSLSEMDHKAISEINTVARLLRGESVTQKLKTLDITMSQISADMADGPQMIVLDQEMSLHLGGEVIELGRRRTLVEKALAVIERAPDGEAGGVVRLAPLPGFALESQIMLIPPGLEGTQE